MDKFRVDVHATLVKPDIFAKRFKAEKERFRLARQKELDEFKSKGLKGPARVSPSLYDIITPATEYNWLGGKCKPAQDTISALEQIGFRIHNCLYDFSV